MAVKTDAKVEVSAFRWVPDFAAGVVRDLRVRWALEEAGLHYRERLLDAMTERPADYFKDQPFRPSADFRRLVGQSFRKWVYRSAYRARRRDVATGCARGASSSDDLGARSTE